MSEPTLVAYRIERGEIARLVPASPHREWMDATRDRFAQRCLPMLIANQAGWMALSPHAVQVEWDGGDDLESLRVSCDAPRPPALSHFGHGILTFHLPYLFRTPPDYDLLVRGPPNWPKDGICALEGLVETSWSVATITMNWKLTRPGRVEFQRDEPFCLLAPVRRGELESFRPALRSLADDPALAREYRRWSASRRQFLETLASLEDGEEKSELWQKHYFRGTTPDGERAPGHQLKLRLRAFDDR